MQSPAWQELLYTRHLSEEGGEMSEGTKFDAQKTPWHLCPLSFVKPLVAVFAIGRERYGFENWKKDFNTPEMTEDQRFISACKRHLEKIEEHGPLATNDEDGGVYHAAQLAWDSLRLLWGALRRNTLLGMETAIVPGGTIRFSNEEDGRAMTATEIVKRFNTYTGNRDVDNGKP